jgi:prepilin-type processing-associated H-X9-DG protein
MNPRAPRTKKPPADSRLPLRPRSGEREFAANPQSDGQSHQLDGFTRMEVLFVVGVLTLGVLLILPELAKTTQRAAGTSCVNQLKSMGVAFRLYANDYDEKNPYQVLAERATNGSPASPLGSFDPTNGAELWRIFQEAGGELSSPWIAVCPTDTRVAATDFEETNLTLNSFAYTTNRLDSLSYWFAPETRVDRPNLLVLGDRNLYRSSTLLGGSQRLGSTKGETKSLAWGSEMHHLGGNIAFSDGHVDQLSSDGLREALAKSSDTNNVVWLPNPPTKKSPGTL